MILFKQLIANQWKHFCVFLTIMHFIGWIHYLISKNPNNHLYGWWFLVLGSLGAGLKYEHYQFKLSKKTLRQYLKDKGWDTLLDLLADMSGAVLGLLPFWILAGI